MSSPIAMGRRLPSAFGKATPLDEHKKDLPGAVPASLREVSLKRNKPTFGDLFTNLNSCGVKPLGPGAESDGKALTMFCRLSSFGGELRRPMRGGFWKGWFAPRGCLARKCSFVPSSRSSGEEGSTRHRVAPRMRPCSTRTFATPPGLRG